jgi:eukaryotic-like serine/threonine-protein kinase
MPLKAGDRLGPYEIVGLVGAGGMGEVYRARDPRLNRDVAVKILHASVAADPERLRRFAAEAQAVAALNHANVLTIYEVGTEADHPFIATELLEGATLRATLEAGALPVSKAIDYARQTASGLAAAHTKGVAHRDIKPENLFVTIDGRIKILDFGLAKTYSAGQTSTEDTHLQSSTSPGMVVGTAGYMSPEQVRARPIDHRTDIFSLGVVLYEMLAGRQPFGGDSAVETMNAILTADPPDIVESGRSLRPALADIVRHCLEKNPDERFQSARDLSFALQSLSTASGSTAAHSASGAGAGGSPRPPVQRAAWLPIAVAAIAAGGLGALGMWSARPAPPAVDIWRVTRVTNDTGVTTNPAISRDGRLVAYVSDRGGTNTDLWVQQVDGGDPVQLTRDLAFCRDPAFSPENSRIAVSCGADGGTVYVVPTLGGLPRRIAEGHWPQFSPDGSQLSYVATLRSGAAPDTISIAPANGGAGRELKPGKPFRSPPIWHPDGKGLFIIDASGSSTFDWYLVSADTGAAAPTGAGEQLRALDFGPGRNLGVTEGGILFPYGTIDSTNIYRMPFDATLTRATGAPAPVIVGAGFSVTPTSSSDGRRIAFAVGTNPSTNIWRAPVDPKTGEVAGSPSRVTDGLHISLMPSPSRDGRRLAYRGGTLRAPEIRLRDFAANTDVRLAEAAGSTYLVLSPDGSTVAFSADESSIYVVAAAGGMPKKICDKCGRPVDWLTDGSKLLIDNAGPKQRDIYIVDVATGQAKPLLQHPEFQLTMPRVSPDGRVLTFTEVRPGRARRINLMSFTGEAVPESQWSVVVDGADFDRQPVWSPSGDIIYYLSDRDGTRCIWAQRVDTSTRKAVGQPFAAHHIHQVRYYLNDVGDPAAVGLTVVNGQMYFAGFEMRSNVWMAERSDGES